MLCSANLGQWLDRELQNITSVGSGFGWITCVIIELHLNLRQWGISILVGLYVVLSVYVS